jgi:hypothetical protein
MHGMIGRNAASATLDVGDGWKPYIPNLFTRRAVWRQLSHRPTLYVMRKRDGWKSFYRACTAEELAHIEAMDSPAKR